MKTLIELYDEEPMRNVLATEMFQPEETVLVCPPEIAKDSGYENNLRRYLKHRGFRGRLTLTSASLLDAHRVAEVLREILKTREDCAIDISGGTDAALFAAGMVSREIPVFTYSRHSNCFFEIQNASFARGLPCTVRLDTEACVMLAGGELLPGREDNRKLRELLPEIDLLFDIFRTFRREWNRQITYLQQISDAADPELRAAGPRTVKVDRGSVTVNEELLLRLAEDGLILNLQLTEEEVAFTFPNPTIRFWLRDVGSALEVYIYKACLNAGVFDDVVLSAVVNWHSDGVKKSLVTNEIDVVAVRGVVPLFISCKTCAVKTEALNELAILRDNFGGKGSRAMIVTTSGTSRGSLTMRKRASEMGVEVLDWEDLAPDTLRERLAQR